MALSLHIDRDDARPLYLQIAGQIRNQVSTGQLPAGTRLPTVRELAGLLGVNRVTAHNAYSELQADGWIESTVGKGTFVRAHARPMALLETMGMDTSADSVLSDIYPIRQMPALRSLAYAEPDTSLAPVDDFWGMLALAKRDVSALMLYDSPQGDSTLRIELAKLVKERNVKAMPDDLMVTSGAMQAISLAALVLARPGDTVLVEQPTYLGLIHMLKMHGLNPISIAWDDEGPRLDQIEAACRDHQPRFFYTVPTNNNPTGRSISGQRAQALLRLAAQHDLYIIEDDIYALLSYDSAPPLPLKAYDRDERVIYISSVSKVMMPGLRVGWMVAPAVLQHRLLSQRRAMDMYGPSFIQRAMAHFLHQGRLKAHLRRMVPLYRERRDGLMLSLQRYLPADVTWTQPQGGFSTWVTLPQANMRQIYQVALQHGIAFTPGDAFLVPPGANQHMRLCFGSQSVADMDDILSILGRLMAHPERYAGKSDADSAPLWTSLA